MKPKDRLSLIASLVARNFDIPTEQLFIKGSSRSRALYIPRYVCIFLIGTYMPNTTSIAAVEYIGYKTPATARAAEEYVLAMTNIDVSFKKKLEQIKKQYEQSTQTNTYA